MKKLFLIMTMAFMLVGLQNTQAQKTATFDQVANKTVKGSIKEYTAESGVIFRIGDTLRIGYPYRNERFDLILNRSKMYMGSGNTSPQLSLMSSGNIAVIKSMKANKRKLTVGTYAKGESEGVIISNFEEAFKIGEIMLPGYMSSDEALVVLKKAKDKLDLNIITEEKYNEIKNELVFYIK